MTDDNNIEVFKKPTIARISNVNDRHYVRTQNSRDFSMSHTRNLTARYHTRRVFKHQSQRAQGSRSATRHVSKIRHGSLQ